MSRQKEIKSLIAEHQRHLQILKEQEAGYGRLNVPPHLVTQIQDREAEIAKLEVQLVKLEGQEVESSTNMPSLPSLPSLQSFRRLTVKGLKISPLGCTVQEFAIIASVLIVVGMVATVMPEEVKAKAADFLFGWFLTSETTVTPTLTNTPTATTTSTATATPTSTSTSTSTPIPTATPIRTPRLGACPPYCKYDPPKLNPGPERGAEISRFGRLSWLWPADDALQPYEFFEVSIFLSENAEGAFIVIPPTNDTSVNLEAEKGNMVCGKVYYWSVRVISYDDDDGFLGFRSPDSERRPFRWVCP